MATSRTLIKTTKNVTFCVDTNTKIREQYKEENCVLTKEIMAANKRILTRRSSNCSKISSHSDLPE